MVTLKGKTRIAGFLFLYLCCLALLPKRASAEAFEITGTITRVERSAKIFYLSQEGEIVLPIHWDDKTSFFDVDDSRISSERFFDLFFDSSTWVSVEAGQEGMFALSASVALEIQ